MKYLSTFVLFSVLFILATSALGKADSASESGRFVTLTHGDGKEFRAFIAGPANAKAGVLVVHDYFGISDATQQAVKHLAALGYRSLAVDLYAGKSATSHVEAVKLMQSLDRKTTDKI